ncbi:helix-turn-helix transcriptional regulator [Thermopirellula anaerolimosa]
MTERLLTAHECAQLLRVSRRHLDRLKAVEGLPFVRLGRRVLFPEIAVRQWLQSRIESVDLGPQAHQDLTPERGGD